MLATHSYMIRDPVQYPYIRVNMWKNCFAPWNGKMSLKEIFIFINPLGIEQFLPIIIHLLKWWYIQNQQTNTDKIVVSLILQNTAKAFYFDTEINTAQYQFHYQFN